MKTEQQIKDEAIALYESASPELKKVLETQFEPGFFEKKRQTIEETLSFLGMSKEFALQDKILLFEFPQNKRERYLNAVSILPLVIEKINDGWVANYENNNQAKYQPYFYKENGGWVAGGYASSFGYDTLAGVGSYQTEEGAINAGEQFIDLYVDILDYISK